MKLINNLFLLLLFVSCGTARQAARTGVDLSAYAGDWIGDDYIEDVDEQGDSVRLGSVLTIDPGNQRIHLMCMGPPPMSRIADFDAAFSMKDKISGRFEFEDSWNNQGHGEIDLLGDMVVIDITIDKPAQSDWQVFEGPVTFRR